MHHIKLLTIPVMARFLILSVGGNSKLCLWEKKEKTASGMIFQRRLSNWTETDYPIDNPWSASVLLEARSVTLMTCIYDHCAILQIL